MTSEIKQRIEQIRRGEVPEEYKKIHGDIVPLTWDQISLADCIVPYSCHLHFSNSDRNYVKTRWTGLSN